MDSQHDRRTKRAKIPTPHYVTSQALDHFNAVRRIAKAEPTLSHAEIGRRLDLKRSRVSNLLRLTRLPSSVLDMVTRGKLSLKHAEWLLRLPPDEQDRWARDCIAQGWTVAVLRQKVEGDDAAKAMESSTNADIARLERELEELVGAAVRLDHAPDNSGWLRLRYSDLDTLDSLIVRLGYQA